MVGDRCDRASSRARQTVNVETASAVRTPGRIELREPMAMCEDILGG
jgi:hypothetical protein